MNGRFVQQEIAPQHDDGVDWSGRGKILVRTAQRRLVWRGGRRYFGGIGIRAYAPAALQVIAFPEYARNMADFSSRELFEGGRLTRPRVEAALPEIRKLMMLPELSMEQIDLKATFVVEGA